MKTEHQEPTKQNRNTRIFFIHQRRMFQKCSMKFYFNLIPANASSSLHVKGFSDAKLSPSYAKSSSHVSSFTQLDLIHDRLAESQLTTSSAHNKVNFFKLKSSRSLTINSMRNMKWHYKDHSSSMVNEKYYCLRLSPTSNGIMKTRRVGLDGNETNESFV